MVDALNDDWWIEDQSEGNVQSNNPEDDQTKKRKLKCEMDDMEEEGPNTEKKKKKKRRKITDALKKEEQKPCKPDDLMTAMNSFYCGKLSTIELEDITLEDKHFKICSDVNEHPSLYLGRVVPKWRKLMKKAELEPGCPLLLILTGSGIRAVELIRSISNFKGEKCKVAKLFAKHFKLKDQVEFLKKTVVHIGIGTPNRIQSLIEQDALHLNSTMVVVLDWSWRDAKYRRLVDIPEVKTDLFELLKKHIIPAAKDTKLAIGLL